MVASPEVLSAPEVTDGNRVDLTGRDKVVHEDPAGLIPVGDPQDGVKQDVDGFPSAYGKPERRCCGLKRKTFLIVLSVLTVVLIAAIVGGVVGGIEAKRSSNDDDSSTIDPVETGPIDADQRSMAAAFVIRGNTENSQVFYNDLNSTSIMYNRLVDDTGTEARNLTLDIEPSWGAPLAVTARYATSDNTTTTQLFYITTHSENSSTATGDTHIARAVLDCGALDSLDACNVTSNDIISSNLTHGVHPASKLAALRLTNDSVRIYFQANGEGANLWVLLNDGGDDDGWTGSNVVGNVLEGSAIAASAQNRSSLHVFYVANTTERLAYVEYSDILGAGDGKFTPLLYPSDAQAEQQLPSSQIHRRQPRLQLEVLQRNLQRLRAGLRLVPRLLHQSGHQEHCVLLRERHLALAREPGRQLGQAAGEHRLCLVARPGAAVVL